jgi:microcystin-dependent protein
MKKLNTPTRSLIVRSEDFVHLAAVGSDMAAAIGQLLQESSAPTRVYGVEFTVTGQDYSCTPGMLAYNGNLYRVEAFSGTAAGSQVPVFSIASVLPAHEPHDTFEGYSQVGTFNFTEEELLVPAFAARGTGAFDFDEILPNPVTRNSAAIAGLQGLKQGMIVDYYGNLSNFNTTGLGVGELVGFALCNGQNGTPDLRGRVTIGLGNSAPANGNPEANLGDYFVPGNVGGAREVALTEAQLAAHSHGVTDPGHTHDVSSSGDRGSGGSGRETRDYDAGLTNHSTSTEDTGITIDQAGGGEAHENRQPYMVMGKVMKL